MHFFAGRDWMGFGGFRVPIDFARRSICSHIGAHLVCWQEIIGFGALVSGRLSWKHSLYLGRADTCGFGKFERHGRFRMEVTTVVLSRLHTTCMSRQFASRLFHDAALVALQGCFCRSADLQPIHKTTGHRYWSEHEASSWVLPSSSRWLCQCNPLLQHHCRLQVSLLAYVCNCISPGLW